MKNSILIFVFLIGFTSLSHAQENQISESLAGKSVWIQYAFYFLDNDEVPLDQIKKLWSISYPEMGFIDSIPNPEEIEQANVFFESITNVSKEYAAPDLEYLEYFGFGMDETQKKELQKSRQVITLNLFTSQSELTKSLSAANQFMVRVSELHRVILWDEFTRECYDPKTWEARRIVDLSESVLDISDHITMHFYPNESEFCRLVTLGMSKFGLPDLVVENLSCYSGSEWVGLINLIAQTLYQNPVLGKNDQLTIDLEKVKNETLKKSLLAYKSDNGIGKGTVRFELVDPKSGDPENAIFEIVFKDSEEQNVQVLHEQIITQVFGFEDEIVDAVIGDEALLAASLRAKKKLPKLKKRFEKGLDIQETLLLKFPFEYGDGDLEYMWVEITKWEGKEVVGILQNEPYYVKDLQAGQQVRFLASDMYDYLLLLPNDQFEGNETGEIIMRQQQNNN